MKIDKKYREGDDLPDYEPPPELKKVLEGLKEREPLNLPPWWEVPEEERNTIGRYMFL